MGVIPNVMTALQRIEILDQIEIYGLTFRELSNKISGGPDSFQHFFLRHSLVVLMLLLSIVICESKLRSLGFNDILLGRVIVRYSFIAPFGVYLFGWKAALFWKEWLGPGSKSFLVLSHFRSG